MSDPLNTAREALEHAEISMRGVTVFVTSRERIKRPEGDDWWSDQIEKVRQAILALSAPEAAPAALEETGDDREWFWRIIDGAGLADLPSIEEDALRILVQRRDQLERRLDSSLASPGESWTEEQIGAAWDEAWAIYSRHQGGGPGDEQKGREAACRYLLSTLNATPPAVGEARAWDEYIKAVLSDPSAVRLNMLRGGIAKPSVADIIHIYGADALREELSRSEAGAPSREAIARVVMHLAHRASMRSVEEAERLNTLGWLDVLEVADAICALYPTPPTPAVKASREAEDVLAIIEVQSDGENTPEQVLHHALMKLLNAGDINTFTIGADAKAALSVGGVGVGWRPIETAPKDGTEILLWVAGETHVIGWWECGREFPGSEPFNGWSKGMLSAGSGYDAGFDRVYSPTHWMPLPPAPDAHLEVGRGKEDHGARAVPQSTIGGPDDRPDDQPA